MVHGYALKNTNVYGIIIIRKKLYAERELMTMAKQQPKEKIPGTNRKVLQNALEALKHPRVDVKDPKAIQERITEYLEYCMKNDIIPGVAACANWLGIHIVTLESWYAGRTGSPEHQIVVSRFYGIMQDVWQQNMDESNINNISGMFMGKVFFGYKDTQEIVVNTKTQNELSVADLIAESKMLPGGENLIIDGTAKILEDNLTETEQKEPVEPKKKQDRMSIGKS